MTMLKKRNVPSSIFTTGLIVLALGIGQMFFNVTEAQSCEAIGKKLLALQTKLEKAMKVESKAEKTLQKAMTDQNMKSAKKLDKKEKSADARSDKLEKKYSKTFDKYIKCVNKELKKLKKKK